VLRGIYTAASGMTFQMQQVDLIAANLANVNTNGYKRKELLGSSFGDLVVQFMDQAPGTEATVGTGVRADGIARFDTPGHLEQTDNRFNVALTGPGYFLTRGSDGVEKLTRDGDFQVDKLNRLVTRYGELVLDTNRRPITLQGNLSTLKIDQRGNVAVNEAIQGSLMVVDPPKAALETRFPVAPPGLTAMTNPQMQQGFLEHSNVNVVMEMVALMEANKTFGFDQKVVTAHDQILQKAANDLGRIQ